MCLKHKLPRRLGKWGLILVAAHLCLHELPLILGFGYLALHDHGHQDESTEEHQLEIP